MIGYGLQDELTEFPALVIGIIFVIFQDTNINVSTSPALRDRALLDIK